MIDTARLRKTRGRPWKSLVRYLDIRVQVGDGRYT